MTINLEINVLEKQRLPTTNLCNSLGGCVGLGDSVRLRSLYMCSMLCWGSGCVYGNERIGTVGKGVFGRWLVPLTQLLRLRVGVWDEVIWLCIMHESGLVIL